MNSIHFHVRWQLDAYGLSRYLGKKVSLERRVAQDA